MGAPGKIGFAGVKTYSPPGENGLYQDDYCILYRKDERRQAAIPDNAFGFSEPL